MTGCGRIQWICSVHWIFRSARWNAVSGDLADLKVKSCDVEAWSPRQKKYFEVGSCSNLGDAQARRLKNPRTGRKWQVSGSYTE